MGRLLGTFKHAVAKKQPVMRAPTSSKICVKNMAAPMGWNSFSSLHTQQQGHCFFKLNEKIIAKKREPILSCTPALIPAFST